jgi:hypothetical protein
MHAVTLLILSMISLGAPKAVTARPVVTARIWTNDDVKTLRAEAPISVVGTVAGLEASTSISTPRAAPPERRPYVKEADPDWYAQEIEARRIEAASAEARLAQIAQTAKTGEGVSGVVPLDKTSPGILLPGTIYVLRQQGREAKTEIDALQDLGRRSGIVAAAWR